MSRRRPRAPRSWSTSAAIRHNVRHAARPGGARRSDVMTVVKADGYGHGMVEAARAAREAGADWLGVATVDEALALRDGRRHRPAAVLADRPRRGLRRRGRAPTSTSRRTPWPSSTRSRAARAPATPARRPAQGRHRALPRRRDRSSDWPDAGRPRPRPARRDGTWRVTGIWSHFACSDEPEHPANDAQERRFREALAVAERRRAAPRGAPPRQLRRPRSCGPVSRFDLVRVRHRVVRPRPRARRHAPTSACVPAMTVTAPLALVKPIAAGAGVSYGHTWIADAATRRVGLVPVGYGDGVPRARRQPRRGLGRRQAPPDPRPDLHGPVRRRPRRRRCRGAGDEVVLFGPGDDGEPTAQDWAEACGTITYEIVTRIGGRLTRRYVDEEPPE